ncbi:putative nuclease HARBI1 [Rhizophagus irregularis DAOM 181602=DAOM 197198]|nr:putative nuclease HARBI1 [Rhizophagus irregularis DAOM 181602=DAOM 197198]
MEYKKSQDLKLKGYTGEAGSVHDAKVFYRSSLYHEILLHPEQWVPGSSYIIADAAYPLRTYLMKAFPNYYMLSSFFNANEWIVKIIHACCILHNICIDMGDLLSSENVNREMDDDINGNNEYEAENEEMEEMAGTQKREYLTDLIIN